MRPRGQTPRMLGSEDGSDCLRISFNEAAGADPADAVDSDAGAAGDAVAASMRPRGQTPRMRVVAEARLGVVDAPASMRPRGQTPRMRGQYANPYVPGDGLQ